MRRAIALGVLVALVAGPVWAQVTPRKIIAVLDGTKSSWSSQRRAVSFYDVTDLSGTDVFGQQPLFSVWTGYEDSLDSPNGNFEEVETMCLNPHSGTGYVIGFDSGSPGVVDVAGDTEGDLDIYRFNYSRILRDWEANYEGTANPYRMYCPTVGPDYWDDNGNGVPDVGDTGYRIEHPDNVGQCVFLDGVIKKIGEVGRTQGTSFFDRDVEFIDPQTLVLMDNESDSAFIDPSTDHEIRILERVEDGTATPDTSVPGSIEGGYESGDNVVESWEADRAARMQMDFGASGPIGQSEPEDMALVRRNGIVGVWIGESDGGGDDVSFFEFANIENPTLDATAATSTIDGAGNSRSLDEDPEADVSTNNGDHDWVLVDAQGRLLIGESGYFDTVIGGEAGTGGTPAGEPTVQRLNVESYAPGDVPLVDFDAWDDLGGLADPTDEGLGPVGWDSPGDDTRIPVQLEGPLGGLTNLFAGGEGFSLDDDGDVTDGRFVCLDRGGNLLYWFDIDYGSAPNVVADVYVVNLEAGTIVYEELNATNHFLIEHGIRFLLRGDITDDGAVTAADIDTLFDLASDPTGGGAHTAAIGHEMYDLTGDGTVTQGAPEAGGDVDELVNAILGTHYGDADLSGLVDTGDYFALASSWYAPAGWAGGDFNGDGFVDTADYFLLSGHWYDSPPTSGSQPLPEPMTMALVALGGLGLIRCRR